MTTAKDMIVGVKIDFIAIDTIDNVQPVPVPVFGLTGQSWSHQLISLVNYSVKTVKPESTSGWFPETEGTTSGYNVTISGLTGDTRVSRSDCRGDGWHCWN